MVVSPEAAAEAAAEAADRNHLDFPVKEKTVI